MALMETKTKGRQSLEAFIRASTKVESIFLASDMGNIILDKIRDRVAQGIFRSGAWANAPYSEADIKAYKLSDKKRGSGMRVESNTMTIDGIVIDDEDWHWGGYLPKDNTIYRKGKSKGRVRTGNRFPFGSKASKPAPVFIGGYKRWITKYTGKSDASIVNLNMTGSMLNALDFDVVRKQGSNQFGGNIELKVFVSEPFNDISSMTNFYREWLYIDENDISEAINKMGLDLFSERTVSVLG